MDPLSDVISLLSPHSFSCSGFNIAGEHSVQFPSLDGVKYYTVVSGHLWFTIEGDGVFELKEGDSIILFGSTPFQLTTKLGLPTTDHVYFKSLIQQNGDIVEINGGGETLILGGHFYLTKPHSTSFIDSIPKTIYLPQALTEPAFRSTINLLMRELRESLPASDLMQQHLACLIIIQTLRTYLVSCSTNGGTWMAALSHKQIGPVLKSVHNDPAFPWSLQVLAGIAGMSRSLFAKKFRETVGLRPMEYISRWRMQKAAALLIQGNLTIAEIAPTLGYSSESAFSAAFKRILGLSPREYVKEIVR